MKISRQTSEKIIGKTEKKEKNKRKMAIITLGHPSNRSSLQKEKLWNSKNFVQVLCNPSQKEMFLRPINQKSATAEHKTIKENKFKHRLSAKNENFA